MYELSAGVSSVVENRVPASFGAPTVIGIGASEPNCVGIAPDRRERTLLDDELLAEQLRVDVALGSAGRDDRHRGRVAGVLGTQHHHLGAQLRRR